MTVDDNGSKHSGTGVWHSTIRKGGFPNDYTTRFEGEAIPIELGSKGTLYALIAGHSRDGHPTTFSDLEVYGSHLFGEVARLSRGQPMEHLNPIQEYEELAGKVGQSATLDCAHPPTQWTSCPFLVRFRDENDPKSVEAVDPKNLAATFGPSVLLEPIKVTIADEPVTTGIRKRLKWLATQKGALLRRSLDVPIGNMPISGQLTEIDFSFGVSP